MSLVTQIHILLLGHLLQVTLTPQEQPTLPTSSPTTMVTVSSALMVMLILSSVGVILVDGAWHWPDIDLGFEPQWVMIKNTTDSNTSWAMFDNMRALSLTGTARLIANSNAAEYNDTAYNAIAPTPTGFNLTNGESWYNASGKTYIYIAIRRGPNGCA